MKLEGKVALVTGSTQGIGQAPAIRLDQEGADIVIDYRSHPEGAEETKAIEGNRFDFIISTISADVDWNQFIAALAPEGRLSIVGIPESELKLSGLPIIHDQRSLSGGRAAAPSDTAAMLELCANHGVAPMCEQFDMKDVNQAVERVRSGKVRYRAVLAR